MVRNRNRRTIIAAVVTVLWLAYMIVGLAAINAAMPTVGGAGPVVLERSRRVAHADAEPDGGGDRERERGETNRHAHDRSS